ncbi:2-dehydropantoate 2-reductase [Virgibacillus natechei]|uniref:2-dehydropantoate 2-reductase n=1 Tax=Virgibacillus natechei TaxID=1216297 RepID=A0ABS4ICC8_9BACI|nr:2-dehydropantoate 2-reductase [Virgibacillus natechei]MBP1968550.1 2-dehydropantoate 2-reductase [Virgibacillus natechei]UZD13664.1 2-dehydropantoate 2-reductase [Virgibacillus natechei]
MHIVVFGAGALGTYVGARLEEAGEDVTFLVREGRAQQIQKNGLYIWSAKGDYEIINPRVITDPNDARDVDLVLISVKGYHLPATLDNLKVLTEKGAYVLPVLNGIEHIETLKIHLGSDSVIGGLSFIMATLNDEGHVIHSSDFHDLIIGELEPTQSTICTKFEEISQKANMHATRSDSISLELWNKYMFINALSGITTATNLPIGPIRANKETFYVAEKVLREMKMLANAYGVQVSEADLETAKTKLWRLSKEATSSMHQDRRKDTTLEVEHLHGGAIRLAEKAGIDLPYTQTIYGIIKPFENG